MIQLENVEKVYRTERIETVALTNVNLTVREGEFISIMGPSGSGKSTLLNVIGLLDVPSGGKVAINEKPITSYSDRNLARVRNEEIGFVFQTFHLINDLSVVDNVEIPLLYRKGTSGSERRKLALRALDRVGLHARVHHFPNQLSGGQQQRVAIARAIVGNPRILLADEPTGNLDSVAGRRVMELLVRHARAASAVVIVATHNADIAAMADRCVTMRDGRITSDRLLGPAKASLPGDRDRRAMMSVS